MTAVDPKRLVLIQVEFAAVDGVRRYESSTGYYLRNDRILTAGHVFTGDALKSITLRSEEGSGKERWCNAELVWHNGSLDAALLKVTDAAPGIDGLPPVRLSRIAENSDWESVGYPAAAEKRHEKEREYKTSGLVGLLYAQGGGGQGRRELELGVSNGAKGDTWQGISGAPVFVGSELVGMIMSCPRNFDGDRLAALPISLLFENPGFLLALSRPWLEPFPKQDWCLILAADSDVTDEVEETLGAVLENNIIGADGKSIDNDTTKVVKANEVLASPERWLQFVRALCVAPILIADVTEFEPAIMLLLGIRAVVRRGVTITVTRSRFGDAEWKDLPFNIQEIKLIQLETDRDICHPEHPVCLIGDAIRDGSAEVSNRGDYLDLPVYDAVRCPEPRDSGGGSTLSETALVLCSFHPKYANHWRYVSDKLLRTKHKADYTPRKFSRMRDIASPRLVGKTLYEHIRWTSCCIVDWTHWRPNVLFELGVRMACSDLHPICLIDKEDAKAAQQDSGNGQRSRMLMLLAPEEYVLGGPSDPFKKSFRSFSQRVQGESVETSLSMIAHGATYWVALEAYDWASNWVIVSPHVEMCKTAEALLVVDQKQGGSQVLFSSNPEFSRQLMSNVRERWIAAWYYFLNRYGKEQIKDSEELMKELIDLGEATQQWLVRSKDPQHRRICAEIGDLLEELESQ